MSRRAIILVIDGLGIGAMDDVPATRPSDTGAHTLLRVARLAGPLHLPTLQALGLGNISPVTGVLSVGAGALAAWGRCRLAHEGADTYMGHQELMGTRPAAPITQLMADVGPAVQQALEAAGYAVEPAGSTSLLVAGAAVVADNIDGEPGQNFNVTGSLDLLPFADLVAIGRVVRRAVRVSRVIVCANHGYGVDAMLAHIRRTPRGQVGIDTPALGLYREGYQVRHLGYGVDTARQLPGLARAAGLPVRLLGKAADVIECPGAVLSADVPTPAVFDRLEEGLVRQQEGLLVANVQETDLAGHAEDAARWAELLHLCDRRIGQLLPALAPGDLLIITGDHGNDPGIGHKQHTRERTPLLALGRTVAPGDLGERATLSDVAATAAAWLGLPPPEHGTCFLPALQGAAREG